MESTVAATLQKKKINKGKLKKTIKNVLCKPDPVIWPTVTEQQKQDIETALSKHKVHIPEFQKPLWKDLKSIPKEDRPKPPKTERVEGLLFGISECSSIIQTGQCSGIIIEATVNPRTIVLPLIESCIDRRIPVICIEGLRKIIKINFGIPTSCLGVKRGCLSDISSVIHELGSNKLPQKKIVEPEVMEMTDNPSLSPMDTQEHTHFEYLYRPNKKTRVFAPPAEEKVIHEDKNFKGQDFIEFSDAHEKKPFQKMIVKKVSNNPNRVKVK